MTGLDLLKRVVPRAAKLESSSGMPFVDAMNAAIEVLFLRLWERRADMIRVPLDLDTTVHPVPLPVTFRGLAEDPYLIDTYGKACKLTLLPAGGTVVMAEETSMPPTFYRLTGSTMTLYPAPSETYDVRGDYFSHPGVMSEASTIPWAGLFNEIIVDATVAAIQFGGITGLLANQPLMIAMDQAVDKILSYRTRAIPVGSGSYFF